MARNKVGRHYLKKAVMAAFILLGLFLVGRAILLKPKIALELIIADKELELPVHLTFLPDGSDRLVVVQKRGWVKWFSPSEGRIGGILLDIKERVFSKGWEDGLLSIAFDPHFLENRHFYVFYSADEPLRSVISRFTLNPQSLTADPLSELTLLEVSKSAISHNGGQLAFGSDGFLYAGIGEGNLKEKTLLQTRTSLLGTIIRIDVNNTSKDKTYDIPSDNPFVDSNDGSRPEIWAYGFRNPWRFSFDRETGMIYAGDVGEVTVEEVDGVVKGGNYGWAVMEGDQCFPPDQQPPILCDRTGLQMPMAAFPRWLFRTVIGGYVYRGNSLPWLEGQYVFADYFRGIYSISIDRSEIIKIPRLLIYRPRTQVIEKGENAHLSSFGEDSSGELYVVSLRGEIYKIAELGFLASIPAFFKLMAFQ